MELIDVYDRNGNRTGKVVERGTPLLEGEYILAVGMWIVNGKNEIFLTKRSPEKSYAPNKWENTGGHVQAGEDCLAAVIRELREETGITARELIPLGPFYPAAAYSDEVIWMYLARGLTFGEQQLDDDEFLNLRAVPLDELARDVLAGRIPDAKTQAAILRVYCMEHGFEPK